MRFVNVRFECCTPVVAIVLGAVVFVVVFAALVAATVAFDRIKCNAYASATRAEVVHNIAGCFVRMPDGNYVPLANVHGTTLDSRHSTKE